MAKPADFFRAPEGATSSELRVLGLKGMGLGAALLVPGVLWFWVAHDWVIATFGTQVGDRVVLPKPVILVIGGPMTAGYALFVIGASRALFGAAAHSKSALVGIVRLLFGLAMTIGLIATAILIAVSFREP